MQSVRIVMRRVGVPTPEPLNVFSAQDTSEYIEYQYLSQGYEVKDTHYLGEVVNPADKSVIGYQLLFVLVKNESYSGDKQEVLGTPVKVKK